MFRAIARSLCALTLGITVGAGPGTAAHAQERESGFLKDYSQLRTETDPLGMERRIWISPEFTADNYHGLLIEKVDFYPSPKPSDRVPAQTLTELRDYLDSALRGAVGSVVPLADKPGPGVARVRVAITAAAVEAGLKPYQLIPIALVRTAAKEATGRAKHDVKLAVEAEITDSSSGEPLARLVRTARGVEVTGDEKLTLAMAKPQIDRWAEAVRETLAMRKKRGGGNP